MPLIHGTRSRGAYVTRRCDATPSATLPVHSRLFVSITVGMSGLSGSPLRHARSSISPLFLKRRAKEICRISEERRRFIRSQDRLDELDNGVDASPQPSDICFLQQPQPLSPLPPPRRRRRRKADNSSDSPCRGIKMIRITVDGESLSHLSSGRKRRIMRTLRFASLCRASRRIGGIAMQEVDDPGNGVSQESLFPSVNPGHCYIT